MPSTKSKSLDFTLTLTADIFGTVHELATAEVTPRRRLLEPGRAGLDVPADIADALTAMAWELGKDQTCGPVRGAGKYMAVTTDHLVELAAARDDARAERDKAYRDRAELLALIARAHHSASYPTSAVIVHGADEDAPGWPVLYLESNPGQLSWHISPDDLDLFRAQGILQLQVGDQDAPVWDGHDDAEKSRRLADIDLRYI